MKNILPPVIAVCALVAVVFQFDLMLAGSSHTLPETTIRFFSFFTILTNTLVAGYFLYISGKTLRQKTPEPYHFSTLTAITVYIAIVGLVYQLFLRHSWQPTGLQRVIDEMLHSLNPALVIIYWLLNRKGGALKYNRIGPWLVYPLVYLAYVLIRGHLSGFYPYPFLDVAGIGMSKVIVNCAGMTVLFIVIAMLFIWASRLPTHKKDERQPAIKDEL